MCNATPKNAFLIFQITLLKLLRRCIAFVRPNPRLMRTVLRFVVHPALAPYFVDILRSSRIPFVICHSIKLISLEILFPLFHARCNSMRLASINLSIPSLICSIEGMHHYKGRKKYNYYERLQRTFSPILGALYSKSPLTKLDFGCFYNRLVRKVLRIIRGNYNLIDQEFEKEFEESVIKMYFDQSDEMLLQSIYSRFSDASQVRSISKTELNIDFKEMISVARAFAAFFPGNVICLLTAALIAKLLRSSSVPESITVTCWDILAALKDDLELVQFSVLFENIW